MKNNSMTNSVGSYAEDKQSKYFQKTDDSRMNKLGNKENKNASDNKSASKTPIKTSQQSVSENFDSISNLPPKATKMNPHFGNKYLFDSAQVVPSVFKLPEFINHSKLEITRRPNAYFSNMADLKYLLSH